MGGLVFRLCVLMKLKQLSWSRPELASLPGQSAGSYQGIVVEFSQIFNPQFHKGLESFTATPLVNQGEFRQFPYDRTFAWHDFDLACIPAR